MNFFGLIVLGIVALIIGVLYWNTDWGLTLIVAGVVAIVGGGITALNPEITCQDDNCSRDSSKINCYRPGTRGSQRI